MLINMTNSHPKIVRTMSESKFDFYLTGSRYWGIESGKSNWDFFVEYSTDVVKWLKNHKFSVFSNTSSYSEDGQCLEVYVHGPRFGDFPPDDDSEPSEPFDPSKQVHVQTVLNGQIKQAVQEILVAQFPNGFTNRIEAQRIWKASLASYRLGLTADHSDLN